jgi:chromosome segregation ATPase
LHGQLVAKEDFEARLRAVNRSVKELQDDRKDLLIVKERCAALVAGLKSANAQQRTLAEEVQKLKEDHAAERERFARLEELSSLRERIWCVEHEKKCSGKTPSN